MTSAFSTTNSAPTYISPEQAREKYNLGICLPSTETQDPESEASLYTQLAESGVAELAIDISTHDFETLIDNFEECIADDEIRNIWLPETYFRTDGRRGSEAGFTRKEAKTEEGLQTVDGKSIFHFHQAAQEKWNTQMKNAPTEIAEFLDQGFDMHSLLTSFAKKCIYELGEVHPNISSVFFPNLSKPHSFLRVLSYDSMTEDSESVEIAKPHFDLGGLTVQAYADADGFWGQAQGDDRLDRGSRIPYPSKPGYVHAFMGLGYGKIYNTGEPQSPIRPLYHGVSAPETTSVEKRHAVILFLDSPLVDFNVKKRDSLPQISSNNDN